MQNTLEFYLQQHLGKMRSIRLEMLQETKARDLPRYRNTFDQTLHFISCSIQVILI